MGWAGVVWAVSSAVHLKTTIHKHGHDIATHLDDITVNLPSRRFSNTGSRAVFRVPVTSDVSDVLKRVAELPLLPNRLRV
jgi:hypothetical protein